MSMNSFIGTAKDWILGSKKVNVDEVVPTADVQTVMIYDEGRVGQALKGVATEEFWLNPPYGRPRNIDYTTLAQFEDSVWVQICTDAKVDAVVGAEWAIVPRKKLERDETEPTQSILDMTKFLEELPSEETFGVCLAEMIPDLEWYDAGVIVKSFPVIDYDEDGRLKEDKFPVDLHVLDGRSFMIEAGVVGSRWKRFWQYSWINPSGIPTAFDVDEIMYFRMRPSSRGFYGTAKLEIIQDVINYLMDSTEAQSKLFENGLFIGGQIDHPDIKDVKELQRKALEYKKNLQGPKKAGKWLVTGGGVKVTGFPFNPEQMQWLDGQKWFAKLVLSIFKIAPSEIGWTEDLNRATGMQQMNIHKSRAVRPLLKCIEDVINTHLIWKKYPDIRFKYLSSLDLEDTMKQAQIDEIYTRIGKVTINELRERDGETILDDEKFDSPFADQPEPQEEEEMVDDDSWGGWNPFDDDTGDTTESEDDETFKITKGGVGSGVKGHTTFKEVEPKKAKKPEDEEKKPRHKKEEYVGTLRKMSIENLEKENDKVMEEHKLTDVFTNWAYDDDMEALDGLITEAANMDKGNSRMSKELEEKQFFTEEDYKGLGKIYMISQEALRKEYPDGKVTLYRGLGEKSFNDMMDDMEGEEIDIKSRNLTSWSDNKKTAMQFADGSAISEPHPGVVISMEVPIEKILSSNISNSQLNLQNESEFLVMGDKHEATIHKFHDPDYARGM